MERSLLSVLGSLLGVTALGFAGAGSGSGPATPASYEGDWRLLEPISYENLTVFPVVSRSGHDTSQFLTLEEGLFSGDVTIREQGQETLIRNRDGARQYLPNGGASVNQLVLTNRSKRPLLLLSGELVSGGKQDRVIAKDRIVAPGADPLPLDVFCVEHGRWSSGSQFAAAKTIVHPSVREQAAVRQSQTDVWDAVSLGSTYARGVRPASPSSAGAAAVPAPRMSASDVADTMRREAPTQSYAKIYGSARVAANTDAMVDEVGKRFRKETAELKDERVVGVVIAYGGEVAWSDIFASSDLFSHYWNKLIRSYAVEAVARPTLREKATTEDAGEFLRQIRGRERSESDPGVYRWRETSEGPLSQIELDALEPKVITIHRLVLRRSN